MQNTIIDLLKRDQVNYAKESLKRPDKGNAFEYGQRSGIVLGLERAMDVVMAAYKKENEDNV